MEQVVKQIFGDLLFSNASLQAQLQEAQKRIAELEVEREKAKTPPAE